MNRDCVGYVRLLLRKREYSLQDHLSALVTQTARDSNSSVTLKNSDATLYLLGQWKATRHVVKAVLHPTQLQGALEC